MFQRRIVSITCVLMFAVLFGGCAAPKGALHFNMPAEERVWPTPPDPPRYRFLGQLTGEANFKLETEKEPVALRALRWIVGLALGKEAPRVLQRPQSGFVDETDGRIYVSDIGRKAVFVFDKTAGRLRIWEQAAERKTFVSPIGIVKGRNNEILVADADLARVIRLNHDGEPVGSIGESVLKRPTGIVRDAVNGRIYVADTQANDVKVFDDDGALVQTFGKKGAGNGEFNAPTHLALAGGKLFVVDTLNSRVQVFSPRGEFLQAFGRRGMFVGDLPRPKGVAVDGDGHIYVVESYYDYLLVYDDQGRPLLPIGGTGAGIGQFYLPSGVWTDTRGRIFVADMFNGRVEIFQYLRHAPSGEKTAASVY